MKGMMNFTCEKCGQLFPHDVQAGNPAYAYNLGWGVIQICKNCCPPATYEEIIQSFDLLLNPIKEN